MCSKSSWFMLNLRTGLFKKQKHIYRLTCILKSTSCMLTVDKTSYTRLFWCGCACWWRMRKKNVRGKKKEIHLFLNINTHQWLKYCVQLKMKSVFSPSARCLHNTRRGSQVQGVGEQQRTLPAHLTEHCSLKAFKQKSYAFLTNTVLFLFNVCTIAKCQTAVRP